MNEQQQRIMAFERRFYKAAANKESDIIAEFGISAVSYYAKLNRVLDDPDAAATDPTLVARLKRIRDSRARLRRAR